MHRMHQVAQPSGLAFLNNLFSKFPNIGSFTCTENAFNIPHPKTKRKVPYHNADTHITGEAETDGVALPVVGTCVGGGRYDGVAV